LDGENHNDSEIRLGRKTKNRNHMKDNIRSITATVLLVLGFSKASAKIERAITPKVDNPEAPASVCIPCNCGV
jgi:dsRNA-specific ribonuclease